MTVKPTFSRLSTLVNGVSNMNAIITQIETAFQNTLSRDGSTPNQMAATLDMNSNRLINLPAPLSGTDAARLADIESILGVTVSSSVVTKRQFLLALASLKDVNLLYQAIPANANNSAWIEFMAARTTAKSGPLVALTKVVYSWVDADIDNLFLLALNYDA